MPLIKKTLSNISLVPKKNYLFLTLLNFVNIIFKTTPTIAARLNPDILTVSVIWILIALGKKLLDKPTINIDAITMILNILNSTFSLFIVLNPTIAIIENNIKLKYPYYITDFSEESNGVQKLFELGGLILKTLSLNQE